jgi:hypothetical protein
MTHYHTAATRSRTSANRGLHVGTALVLDGDPRSEEPSLHGTGAIDTAKDLGKRRAGERATYR